MNNLTNAETQGSPETLVMGSSETAVSDEGGSNAREVLAAVIVEQPGKIMRITSMIRQLLEEMQTTHLDEVSRRRVERIHASSLKELKDGLTPELAKELDRVSLPFSERQVPTDAELRIVQAQLVGWLEGLLHGVQAALFTEQMEARDHLKEMRRKPTSSGRIERTESCLDGAYL